MGWSGGLDLMQTVLEWPNFSVNLHLLAYVKTDYFSIYYVHHIGYSLTFIKKVNLGFMMYILKLKYTGLAI